MHRLGAQPPCRPRSIDGGVPAPVDDDPASDLRRPLVLHAVQEGHGVDDPRRCARRDVGPATDPRAHRQERGVEIAVGHRGGDVGDRTVQLELDAERLDTGDLGVEDVPGQPIPWDPVAHHPPGRGCRVAQPHRVAQPPQVVRGREPRRAGADDQHARARGDRRRGQAPALGDRQVAEEPLDRVDADGLVELAPVTGRLARVVADAPHHGRERVVGDELAPCRRVVPGLGEVEPALDVLRGRAGAVAGRQVAHVLGSLRAPGSGVVGPRGAHIERDRERSVHQCSSSPPSPEPVAGDVAVRQRLQCRDGLGSGRVAEQVREALLGAQVFLDRHRSPDPASPR